MITKVEELIRTVIKFLAKEEGITKCSDQLLIN